MATNSDTRNLVLTGFMGTGKTSVGKLVAERTGRQFLDMDAMIEHRTGLTIPRIFAQESEPYFRAMERGLSCELALLSNLVIATGGGALIDEFNYNVMAKTGFVVCLTASPETIESRLRGSDARPLAGRWRELLDMRAPVYAAMSNQLDTTDKSVEQVAGEILTLWQNASRS